MSWSKGVVVALVLFALYMMYFLFRAIMSGSESVPEKYYEKGNAYQQELNNRDEAARIGMKPVISFSSGTQEFVVSFDSTYADSGMLMLQWPPSEKQNFQSKMNSFEAKPMRVKKTSQNNGFWNAELVYFKNGLKFRYVQKVWTE